MSEAESAALLAEVQALRDVLIFADGYAKATGYALADLYAEDSPAQGVLQRAGCHPRTDRRERPTTPTYDDPVCIVCEQQISTDENCTKSSEGYWWHYGCRRGVDEAVSRLTHQKASDTQTVTQPKADGS